MLSCGAQVRENKYYLQLFSPVCDSCAQPPQVALELGKGPYPEILIIQSEQRNRGRSRTVIHTLRRGRRRGISVHNSWMEET